jgi:hypothetical protein
VNLSLLSIADVERLTRVPRSWITYEMQTGRIVEPDRLRGRRCFSPEQAEDIRTKYAAHLEKKQNRQKNKEKRDGR